jgi:hypothetical protein
LSGLSKKSYKGSSEDKKNKKIKELSEEIFVLFSFYEKFMKNKDDKI